MAVFRYIATELASRGAPASARRRGELAADSDYQVRLALRRMGLLPLRVTEVAAAAPSRDRLRLRELASRLSRGRRRSQLIELYESMSALLSTGTPLAQALDILAGAGADAVGARRRAAPMATLCRVTAERIRQGQGLAGAMAERPDWFGAVDIALVGSAEQTGETDRALGDLAEHHGRADQLRGRLASAMAYPALLLVFGFGVVIFLTTTTLPQLAGAIQDAGAELPRSTAALLWLGDTLRARWLLAILTAAASAAALAWALRTARLARLRLRTPVLGRAAARAQIGSASLLLERLLRGGIPLSEALALTSPTVRSAAIRDALSALREQLQAGRTIAAPLSESGLFEPVFCRVLEVGQESGELPQALGAIGKRYQESSKRSIDRLAAALEPAVILLLAAAIGFVVFAAIAPMLRLAAAL